MNDLPFVSALLVTRNEQNHIEKALLSLINQTYPKDRYEIIVIDGESSDKTLERVNKIRKEYITNGFDIRILTNPKHILAAGWNLGIQNAKGEYVVRIDAHGEAATDFLEKSIETILEVPDAVCVGGKLITKSLGKDKDIISKVLSSPFGVGNSSFRVSDTAGYADTAVYGLYRKSIFDKVGFFNEQYVRNQDLEFHSRIKAFGGKFYFNPDIKSIYYARNSLMKMIKQAFGNGKWNMVLIKDQHSALSLRHFVPFVFVLYIITSTVLGFFSSFFWIQELFVFLLHLFLGFLAAIKKTTNLIEILVMPFIFLTLHISYGLGFFAGLFTVVERQK